MNQELFEKHRCNQSSHYEKNMDDFHYKGKLSCATTAKSTPFAVCKDERDTKEDADKAVKNALYILWYAKRHCARLKQHQTVKKSSP